MLQPKYNSIPSIQADITAEMNRQQEKWGVQNHPDVVWDLIFHEEAGEVSKAVLECMFDNPKTPEKDKDIEGEIVQTIAVLQSWLLARYRIAHNE